jgi:hypothetical protein
MEIIRPKENAPELSRAQGLTKMSSQPTLTGTSVYSTAVATLPALLLNTNCEEVQVDIFAF